MKHFRFLSLAIFALLFSFNVRAEDTHLLIFRHSGIVESMKLSEISSIELSKIDREGIEHEKYVSQHFKMGDSTLVIPINDIDSVSFGNRNIIREAKSARRIKENELPYILSFDGTKLIYSLSSPSEILPIEGEKLYYDGFVEIFPYGFCGGILNKKTTSEGYVYEIKCLHPSEIFDEYIITGDFDLGVESHKENFRSNLKAEFTGGFDHETSFEFSPMQMSSQIKGGLAFRNFVGSPTREYYSADIYLNSDIGLDFNLETRDSEVLTAESTPITVAQGTIAGLLYPRLDLNLFFELEASLSVGLNLHRNSSLHYRWTQIHGVNTFELINDQDQPESNYKDKARIELVLEGRLFLGAKADLSINTLFNAVGAGIEAKIGPELKGEIGAELLTAMEEEYNSEYYAKASLNSSLLVEIESYIYHIKNLFSGEKEKNSLPFKAEARFLERNIDLLPQFSTRAVRMNGIAYPELSLSQTRVIEVASTTENQILKEIGVGFQIEDKKTNEVISTDFYDEKVESQMTEKQGFNHLLPFEGNSGDVIVRPLLKYAGKQILGAPAEPLEGAVINNIYAQGASNLMYGVAGSPIVGQKDNGETSLIVGNILPVTTPNPVFKKKRSFKMVGFIDEDGIPSDLENCSIIGEWESEGIANKIGLEISKEVNESRLNGKSCTAELNYPQPGVIRFLFEEQDTVILCIRELKTDFMKITFGNSDKEILFKRK